MRWHRETDYHNGRRYDEEAPPPLVVSRTSLTLAWLLDAARRQFDKLLKAGGEPSLENILLKSGDRRGFSVLGAPRHSGEDSATTSRDR